MGGSSKQQTTSQAVSIPQDVLNRYNTVNASASSAANTPFQSYSSDPNAFVAPLNASQQSGVEGTAQYWGAAQPYFNAATGQLNAAQNATAPYYAQATGALNNATATGNQLAGASLGALGQANASAQPYTSAAGQNYTDAFGNAQPYNAAALGSYYGGQATANQYQDAAASNYGNAYTNAQGYNNAATGAYQAGYANAQPLQAASAGNIGQAQSTGYGLGSQALGTLDAANAASNPLQYGALGTVAGSLAGAQPANAAATAGYIGGLAGSQPYNTAAAGNIQGAQNVGQALGTQSLGTLGGAQQAAGGLQSTAQQGYADTQAAASPYNTGATGAYLGALGSAQPLQGQAAANVGQAQSTGNAYAGASTGALAAGQAAANPLYGGALSGIQSSLAGAQGLNALSGAYTGAGAGAVNPSTLDAGAINQYMNPYLSTVLGSTSALLNQNNQQAMSGQLGNAITSGAFGGDRAGIAAANLSQQQNLANANIYSGIGSQAFNTALGAAQQQQGVGLAAGQANRAALQQAAGQYLNLGQQGFAQGQQAAGAQAGIAGSLYGQGLTSSQQLGALGGQQFGQGLAASQQQQSLGQQNYNQLATLGQNLQGVGAQTFGQGQATAGAQAALGQQEFGQGLGASQQQAALGQQLSGLGLSAAGAQAGLGQNVSNQFNAAAQGVGNIGQQGFAQGLGAAGATSGIGGQLFQQGATTAGQQAGIGQNLSGLDLSAAGQQAALGQQTFGQGAALGQGLQNIGNTVNAQGNTLAGAQQGLGAQAFGQAQQVGSNVANLGQQQYGQQMGLGTAQQGLGGQLFGQGATTAGQLGALGQQQFGQGVTASQQAAGIGQDIYGTGAATSQALAGLGAGSQAAGLQGAAAQLAAGQVGQQTEQAGKTALYNQFLQQQSYPFQVQQFLANIAEGTGALSGSTTTTTQPGGFFSDERLKEDIQPIGQTFDGQTIHSYRYKGDPRTQIGLIAQDVERRHPEAVGLSSGYKTVDYGKATDAAAERGHFARGGLSANDNRWAEPRRALAYGGYGGAVVGESPMDIESYLQSAEAPISPYGLGGLYGATPAGTPHGGATGYVPSASLPVGHLAVAQGMPTATSPMENATQIADLVGKGKSAVDWAKGEASRHRTSTGHSSNAGAGDDYSHKVGGKVVPFRANGGPIDDMPQALDIPNDKPGANTLPLPGKPPEKPKSGFDALLDLAKTGAQVATAFAKRGGKVGSRSGYADGGDPNDDSDLPQVTVPLTDPGQPPGNTIGRRMAAGMPVHALSDVVAGLAPAIGEGLQSGKPSARIPVAGPTNAALDARFRADIPRLATAGEGPAMDAARAALRARRDQQEAAVASLSGGAGIVPKQVIPDNMPMSLTERGIRAAGMLPGGGNAQQLADGMDIARGLSNRIPPKAEEQAPLPGVRGIAPPLPPHSPPLTGTAGAGMGSPALGARPIPPRPTVGAPPPMSGIAARHVAPRRAAVSPPVVAAQPSAVAPPPPPALSMPPSTPQAPPPNALNAPTPASALPSAPGPQDVPQGQPPARPNPMAGIEHALAGIPKAMRNDPNILLSVLSGIAAMGTAPTVHPGVALAAGLGAGTQTYLGARQQSAEIARTQAETGAVPAHAQAAQAAAYAQAEQAFKEKNLSLIEDPNGQIVIGSKHYKAVPTGALISPLANTPATGAASSVDTTPVYTYLGSNGQRGAEDAFQRAVAMPPEAMSHEYAAQTAATDAAQEAQGTLPTYFRWASSVTGARGTPAEAGAWNGVRTDAINQWNLLMSQLGLNDAKVTGLDDAQMARKSSVGAAALREAGMGMRSATGLIGLMQATPNPDMTSNAQLQLIADAMTDQMRMMDHAQHQREFSDAVGRQYGPAMSNTFRTQDETNAFQHDFTPQRYLQDRTALMKVFQNPQFATIARGLQGPNAEANARALDEFYHTPGLHAYWTGNRGFGQ